MTDSQFTPSAEELLTLKLERERLQWKMREYRRFSSEDQLARYNSNFGYHWFDADSKRFFRSRVGAILSGQSPANFNYFVSSEKSSWDAQRFYTVRQLHIDGSIETIGEFQQYASSAAAKRAIVKLIKSLES